MEHLPQPESAQELFDRLMAPQPTVIGIEGGPCSGKTTLVERVRQAAGDREIVVLPEAATEHIAKLAEHSLTVPELAANDREGFLAFETDVLRTTTENIERAREEYAGTDAIIVADRCDIGAYLTADEYQTLLAKLGRKVPPMLDLVDQLYYLPSVAIESPERYQALKSTNGARYESLEEAQATCRANLAAVGRHPELHVAWGDDFETKLAHLTSSILEPEQETELALEYLDANRLIADIRLAHRRGRLLSTSRVEQSYHRLDDQEFRLRKMTTERGEHLYFFTHKSGEGLTRHELQRCLTAAEFELLQALPKEGNVLAKTRYELLQPKFLSAPGNLRKWTVDHYDAPHLMQWRVEIELWDTSREELFPWNYYPKGNRVARPATTRARDLAQIALS